MPPPDRPRTRPAATALLLALASALDLACIRPAEPTPPDPGAPSPSGPRPPGPGAPSPPGPALAPTPTASLENRLAGSSSPYLLQHAGNPVAWQPWDETALSEARRLDRPIFLSVGYSTCHWCHVMEHESFEDPEVAKVLNEGFVAIKVDREERPDLDQVYLLATQITTGRGGWPNSVWLTPDGRPWLTGTYFPRDRFLSMLRESLTVWRTQRDRVEAQADRITDAVRRMADPLGAGGMARASYRPPGSGLRRSLVESTLDRLAQDFDAEHGGFGRAPKFPPHQTLRLLLHELRERPPEDPERRTRYLAMATGTLTAMARGGLHDHVGGGFHRYSVDAEWFLPHFEKMLYDNALLLRAFAEGFALTGDPEYRDAALGIVAWLRREMQAPEGGFFAGLDADSEGEEGRFYLWPHAELLAVLGPDDGAALATAYGAVPGGNHRDEASGKPTGRNLLARRGPVAEALAPRLPELLTRLRDARARRPRPALDDKVLVGWNGLTIGALAAAGRFLAEPELLDLAREAARSLLARARTPSGLARYLRAGTPVGTGFLEDHAYLADGLLDLADATAEPEWREAASELATSMVERFLDPEGGGFFDTPRAEAAVLARTKDPSDEATPSAQSVAVRALARLGSNPGQEPLRTLAERTLEASAPLIEKAGIGMQGMLHALLVFLDLAPSQGKAESRASARQAPVALGASLRSRPVAGGPAIPGVVTLEIDPGWHLQSGDALPPMIATRLSTAAPPDPGLSARLGALPSGTPEKVSWSPSPLTLYQGRMEIPLSVSASPDTTPGPRTLVLSLAYQACDDRRCLEPASLELALPLEVVAAPSPGTTPLSGPAALPLPPATSPPSSASR